MTRLRVMAPLLVAAALTGVAVVTVQNAGCDEPGHYQLRADGYELVGGCVAPGDLVVPDQSPRPLIEPVLNAPAKG
jgi:hypothetical protein